MASGQTLARVWKPAGAIKTASRQALPYALPFVSVLAALLLQLGLQQILPAKADFPYAFFYLVAAFASAWYGGYGSGALACVVVMVGIPLAGRGFSRMPPLDFSRLSLFIGVSLLISRVARTQRRVQQVLRSSNDELDRRVHERTSELAFAVEQLQAEIAGHRKTEASLRESEDRGAFALEGAGLGRWDLDLVTGKTSRSLRHDQIFGYDELLPEWTYETMLDHILPEDRPRVAEQFEAARQGGSVWDFECRTQPPGRAIRWIWGRGKIRRDESGQPVSILGIIRDITDRKLAEQRLRAQVERLNLLDQITRAIGERQDLREHFSGGDSKPGR